MAELGYLYRYESHRFSNGVDEFDNPYPGYGVGVYLQKYRILRRTPKGWRIEYYNPGGKFVLETARKRFASPTIAEAKESFRRRKAQYLRILNGFIQDTHVALRKIEGMRDNQNLDES